MRKPIDIERFIKAFGFVKQETGRHFATIGEIARMLGVPKYDVMQFTADNAPLLHLDMRTEYKETLVRDRNPFTGKTLPSSHYESRVSKRYGLCVFEAYPSREENPWQAEWLHRQIHLNEKTVYISEWDNYGQIEGHYLAEDTRPSDLPDGKIYEDNRKNTFLWRNTYAKLAQCEALGATFKKTFYFGGFGDCSSHEVRHAIDAEGVKKLEAAGWTIAGKWF